jgi:hypothetical protein
MSNPKTENLIPFEIEGEMTYLNPDSAEGKALRETDLPNLSQELQEIFQDICDAVFVVDPYNCSGFPNHPLRVLQQINHP